MLALHCNPIALSPSQDWSSEVWRSVAWQGPGEGPGELPGELPGEGPGELPGELPGAGPGEEAAVDPQDVSWAAPPFLRDTPDPEEVSWAAPPAVGGTPPVDEVWWATPPVARNVGTRAHQNQKRNKMIFQ